MSTLYLIALCGVGLALLVMVVEAIASVSREPPWTRSGLPRTVLEPVERREQALSYVGRERREAQDVPVEPVREARDPVPEQEREAA